MRANYKEIYENKHKNVVDFDHIKIFKIFNKKVDNKEK